jgi:hypothetical protein
MSGNRTKEFLTDFRKGMRREELMSKYRLSHERLQEICLLLRRTDLAALRKLWEQDKLSESQFSRAFEEVQNDLENEE